MSISKLFCICFWKTGNLTNMTIRTLTLPSIEYKLGPGEAPCSAGVKRRVGAGTLWVQTSSALGTQPSRLWPCRYWHRVSSCIVQSWHSHFFLVSPFSILTGTFIPAAFVQSLFPLYLSVPLFSAWLSAHAPLMPVVHRITASLSRPGRRWPLAYFIFQQHYWDVQIELTSHTFTHWKCTVQWVFLSSQICDSICIVDLKTFRTPERYFYLSPIFPSPKGTANVLSVSMGLPILQFLYSFIKKKYFLSMSSFT